jgi:hypothetical protein
MKPCDFGKELKKTDRSQTWEIHGFKNDRNI